MTKEGRAGGLPGSKTYRSTRYLETFPAFLGLQRRQRLRAILSPVYPLLCYHLQCPIHSRPNSLTQLDLEYCGVRRKPMRQWHKPPPHPCLSIFQRLNSPEMHWPVKYGLYILRPHFSHPQELGRNHQRIGAAANTSGHVVQSAEK